MSRPDGKLKSRSSLCLPNLKSGDENTEHPPARPFRCVCGARSGSRQRMFVVCAKGMIPAEGKPCFTALDMTPTNHHHHSLHSSQPVSATR